MQQPVDFLSDVRRLVEARVEKITSGLDVTGNAAQLVPGKMLRTKLASHLLCSGQVPADRRSVESACAATEMAHTASLVHDDLIDGGYIRRNLPALWRSKGASAAVLIGDCLFCEAMDILFDIEDGHYVKSFIVKLQEVCAAEAEQELHLRGQSVDEATCLRIARGKTGPFFAFVGQVCGGNDKDLCSALEAAGYCIGTAYQIADDLFDVVGCDEIAGKTLGTDLDRGKFTISQNLEKAKDLVLRHILEQSESALHCLGKWPHVREAVNDFLASDLQPVLNKQAESSDLLVRCAT